MLLHLRGINACISPINKGTKDECMSPKKGLDGVNVFRTFFDKDWIKLFGIVNLFLYKLYRIYCTT